MFQEDYEEYLQDPKNFSHLAAVPDLLMEAMEEVRLGMHQMKEELAMMKSEIDDKSKTRKKYFFCASVCGFLHCVENTELGGLMYVFSLRLATIAPCHSVSLMYGSAL